MCNVLSSLSTVLGLAMVAPNPRPGGRRGAPAWAAWTAAGIVLALMAVSAPAGYAASGTAPPAPSLRSGTPPAPQKKVKGTQAPAPVLLLIPRLGCTTSPLAWRAAG